MDKLTYAENLPNLADIESKPNYVFVKADICYLCDRWDNSSSFRKPYIFDCSIKGSFAFSQTNVMGTLLLLQVEKLKWNGDYEGKLFYHISTDEVYGALEFDGTFFTETAKYDSRSPYSASKVRRDHFVRTFDTYGMPILVTNCSSNYRPYQFPEKFIPLFINNIRHDRLLLTI